MPVFAPQRPFELGREKAKEIKPHPFLRKGWGTRRFVRMSGFGPGNPFELGRRGQNQNPHPFLRIRMECSLMPQDFCLTNTHTNR